MSASHEGQSMRRTKRNKGWAFLLCLLALPVSAKERVEKYPDGKVQRRYTVNDEGVKEGKYEEFDPDGRPLMSAAFVDGKLEGKATYHEKGKAVRTLAFKDGKPQYERSLAELRKSL